MFSKRIQTTEFDPYVSTYTFDYKNPNKLHDDQERKFRIERATGIQCSPGSFILTYEAGLDRTTVGKSNKVLRFEVKIDVKS